MANPIMPPTSPMPMPPTPDAGASALPPIDTAPASPAGVPPMGADPSAPPFDPDTAMADLMAGREGLKEKEGQIASNKIMSDNEIASMKETVIGDLFALMQKMGVDPSSTESVSQFLEALKEKNPDLYELFDYAFNNLIGETPTEQPPELGAPSMSEPGSVVPGDFANLAGAPGVSAPGMPDSGAPTAPTPMPGEQVAPIPKDFGNITAAMGQ